MNYTITNILNISFRFIYYINIICYFNKSFIKKLKIPVRLIIDKIVSVDYILFKYVIIKNSMSYPQGNSNPCRLREREVY